MSTDLKMKKMDSSAIGLFIVSLCLVISVPLTMADGLKSETDLSKWFEVDTKKAHDVMNNGASYLIDYRWRLV